MKSKEQSGNQEKLRECVVDENLCTGCGACVNLCPYIASYEDKIIAMDACNREEGRCYAFCPRTYTDLEALRGELFNPDCLTPEIGSFKGLYMTRAADEKVRSSAQHGGTVTTLIALALQEQIIDTSIIAKIADGVEGFPPNGVMVKDPSGVVEQAKSSFVVSPIVAAFNEIAKSETNKKIGVVATPCQALAFAKMRSKPFPAEDSNQIDKLKLVIGLFCGWAFSWRKLKHLLEEKVGFDSSIVGMDIPPSKYHCMEVYTTKGTVEISLDEVVPCVREACNYCFDLTAEFSDISVGGARSPEGWEVDKNWNQVIVRTEMGQELIELARSRELLEFRDVPDGNLERLKKASMNKKRTAIKNLIEKSGSSEDLLYLNSHDPVFCNLGS